MYKKPKKRFPVYLPDRETVVGFTDREHRGNMNEIHLAHPVTKKMVKVMMAHDVHFDQITHMDHCDHAACIVCRGKEIMMREAFGEAEND